MMALIYSSISPYTVKQYWLYRIKPANDARFLVDLECKRQKRIL